MIRCKSCCMPPRPDTAWVDGECSACINYRRRPLIDWDARKAELVALLDRHDGRCIVPSSGGKDSTAQVMTLLGLGADVTVVTARTCHLTAIGRANIDNLARHARTIEVVPNMKTRAKLNKLGMELVGDISWPEHAAIFSTPFNVAAQLDIPLIFYGENPQDQYGGPMGSEDAREMTMRWRSEFGGFLGLRPSDFEGMDGITDMRDYTIHAPMYPHEAHFLGAYIPWDSHRNAEVAERAGMRTMFAAPCKANWWRWENLDNAQTGLHDHAMFLKYGYGRGCAQSSVDVRAGWCSREDALRWVEKYDGIFPTMYCGVLVDEVLDRIGTDRKWLDAQLAKFKGKL